MMLPSKPARLQLSPEGTYVFAGGLGSLGLDIAELLFEHGAAHVVFLSRTGGSIDSQERLAAFQRQGHRAEHFKCDITSAADVRNVSDTLATNRCSIKGLIQCAMVLEDGIFETMPFARWQRATKPKIQGTRNLHDGLTKDLNFFITLSSIVCVIGNAARANYAAGNTFEDAFAYWRRSQGLAGTTINVGIERLTSAATSRSMLISRTCSRTKMSSWSPSELQCKARQRMAPRSLHKSS
jgi:NAD(P)-dependent dehydrogenase (short-subunit alcohol dehydrogenase family)